MYISVCYRIYINKHALKIQMENPSLSFLRFYQMPATLKPSPNALNSPNPCLQYIPSYNEKTPFIACFFRLKCKPEVYILVSNRIYDNTKQTGMIFSGFMIKLSFNAAFPQHYCGGRSSIDNDLLKIFCPVNNDAPIIFINIIRQIRLTKKSMFQCFL